ncbi:hypothetical protein [Ekhidna sp.]|uniref:hypothetical protein n=1 Tax=Ekhidna sp. TaxID=2608089 RepID=UPI003B59DAB5
MKKLLIPFIILMACQQQSGSDKLPFMGNTIYEENDTIYHTIQDFQLVDQDSSIVTNETFDGQVM